DYPPMIEDFLCRIYCPGSKTFETIKAEVYVCQPLGFEYPNYPNKVYKVVKALYGLHQAPRAWYETLANYLLENGFQRGKIDQTLFIKKQKGYILLVQVYVDDITFGSTNKELCKAFEKLMKDKFQMTSTTIETEKPLLKDLDCEDVDVHIYSEYARASFDRKSTTRGCQFLGCRLIYWQCKKQTVFATSSIEAEYVAAASCCAQVLWIQNQLLDYGKELACPKQTALGKDISNPFMAGSLPKTKCYKLMLFGLTKVVAVNLMLLGGYSEDVIRRDLHLDDVDGVECFSNEEIFAELARMCYEKPPPKLTFYKAFFSTQWKFLIHTLVQCLSAKRTAWNEFSYSMASAVICLATVVINNQVDDLTSHNTRYTSPTLTQKVFANMRRVEVEMPTAPAPPSPTNAPSSPSQDPTPTPHATPPQDQPSTPPASPPQENPTSPHDSTMPLLTTLMETCATLSKKVAELEQDKHTQALEILKLKKMVKKLEKKKRSKHLGFKRLRKVGTSQRVESSVDTVVEVPSIDAKLQGRIDQEDVNAASKGVNASEPTVFDDEENMAGYKMEHFRGMTYEKVRPIFEREYKKVQTLFKPDKDVEEPKKKRVAEETLLQESFKKLKAVEVSGSESTQEIPSNDSKEMSEEDVQNMLEIVPFSKFKVKALQVKYPIIDWEIHTEEKDYPLSNVVMILMLSGKLQVEEDNEMARDLVMKIFMEANKPKSRSKVDTAAEVIKEFTLSVLMRYAWDNLGNDMHYLHTRFESRSACESVRADAVMKCCDAVTKWVVTASCRVGDAVSSRNLNEDLIQNILSGSPLLEKLVLHGCYGFRQIDITSKSVKKFVFSDYMTPEEDINVKTKLDYMTGEGAYDDSPCDEAEEVFFKGLILGLRHVKEIKIGTFCSKFYLVWKRKDSLFHRTLSGDSEELLSADGHQSEGDEAN
nr:putative ribonuclease H-like domain-containing protein [Tanacetum cinerariifolium]